MSPNFLARAYWRVNNQAISLGMFVRAIEHWPGHYQAVSFLCHEACLPIVETPDELEQQLDMFTLLDHHATSQFLLGIGIAGSDA